MANFVTDVSESWDIQSKVQLSTFFFPSDSLFHTKVAGVCSDTASNMTNMMSHLPGLLWNGCLNHVIQLVVNVISFKKSLSALINAL